ncbi:hypothetical protein K2X40_01600 [Candidatus Babeliales bacterium]|nr:hypothetical protein [Candidatus Babeliales bacterium]
MLLSMLEKPVETITQETQGVVSGAINSIYNMILGALILKIAVAIAIVIGVGAVIYWVLKTCNHKNKRKR